jgi:uncharacterized protein YxjI
VEGHSRRLEQVEDKISELKDKIEIKEKNRRTLSQTTMKFCHSQVNGWNWRTPS